MATSNPPGGDRIIVGLDFGSTYSGLTWVSTDNPGHRETITTWPGEEDRSEQVPTKVRYAAGETQWGFGVPMNAPPGEVVEWFKLDLDPSLLPLKEVVVNRKVDRDVDVLVSGYVSGLLSHLATTLTQRFGREIATSTFDLVLAVPAIWTDAGKTRIQRICETASGASVRLVSESQAAAAYAIRDLGTESLSVGETIVVLDAGGGTVDLTTYNLKALDPLEIEEAAPPTGALCGSAFLNIRFEKYLKLKLGTAEGFDGPFLAESVAHFEKEIKRLFTVHAPPSETYPFPAPSLPDNASLGIAEGTFALPVSDIHLIFEPVILETMRLVKEHVSPLPVTPKAVLLVGGFCGSDYLCEKLREALRGVEILRPSGPWSAVAQGAAIMGLEAVEKENQRGGERVRRYGIELVERYNERLHSSIRRKRHWCGLDGCYKVAVMHWFPDGSDEEMPPVTPFHWTSPVASGRISTVKLDIYVREAAGPPPLSRDSTVVPLRRVEADLTGVPMAELKRRRGLDGRSYYDLKCGIEAVHGPKKRQYVLLYNGQAYDAVTARFSSSG